MVKQYPHKLKASYVNGSLQDTDGNWLTGPDTIVERPCRAEPNSRNALVTAADGKQIVYEYVLYMQLPMETIPLATELKVYNGEELLCTNTVKRFERGQLNARIWL